MREPSAESFLRDTEHHQMSVLHDQGLYRHLRFKHPQSSNMWFDLVTWPGYLTISGDMGCWTFSRMQDMLTFFRSPKLEINADYWAEKLQHGTHGGRDGAKVWNGDLFRQRLVGQLTDYYDLEGSDLAKVTQALKEQVLNRDNKYELLIATRDFSCVLERADRFAGREERRFEFDSCELPDGMEYAYHFIWCLYAIVWGIRRYDASDIGYRVAQSSVEEKCNA